ncbi:hypothetical protein [Ureibacillus thermosphaericus]|uniref:hypothetical protein n=1 Tax=Ureibacillus thermosphaericus TaxID=51173 RepID=UPI0002D4BB97|nr:hypothetical protein [Ureibacillus thermosphaericus]
MKIKIGDKNKIKESIIGEQINVNTETKKESFFHRHPVFTSLLTSFVIGFILLFSFWGKVIDYIEGLFK